MAVLVVPRMAAITAACTNLGIISNLLVVLGSVLGPDGAHAPNADQRGLAARPAAHVSADRQLRGGRKGGPTARACNAAIAAKDRTGTSVGGSVKCENVVVHKLKDFSTQPAMNGQSCALLSQGFIASGQQSCIGSAADISVGPASGSLIAAPPAAGSTATATAMTTANMVRTKGISRLQVS